MKNQITIEQLQKDGIAQLKTKQKMVKENIILNLPNKKLEYTMPFIHDIQLGFTPSMKEMFGRSFKVTKALPYYTNSETKIRRVGLVFKEKAYYWPIEAIEK